MGRPKLPVEKKLVYKAVLLSPVQVERLEKWVEENKASVGEIIRLAVDKYFDLPRSWDKRNYTPRKKVEEESND